jgi:biopolymer transport protein ExbB
MIKIRVQPHRNRRRGNLPHVPLVEKTAMARSNSLAPAVVYGVWMIALVAIPMGTSAHAQQPAESGQEAGPGVDFGEAQRRAEEALASQAAEPTQSSPAPAAPGVPRKNLFELQLEGGPLMIPIAFMAILMVTFGIERMLALRRRKVLPPELVQELGELAARKGGLDPRKAYRVCQQHPSAAASVIRATLLKVGRPHSEVEHAVVDASEREAARLYKNVRPINLATAVSPLLGLLGTVQGMIEAFALTAAGIAGVNKAEQLAGGIYVALVTTFAGLCVAIPGAMLSHYFEGRIQSLFRDIDELLLGLLPQLERFEGKLRMSRSAVEESPREPGSHRESDVGEKPPLPVASQS